MSEVLFTTTLPIRQAALRTYKRNKNSTTITQLHIDKPRRRTSSSHNEVSSMKNLSYGSLKMLPSS